VSNLISSCSSALHLTTPTRRLRAAGFTLGLMAAAVVAGFWSSAMAASIKKPTRPVITHLSLSGSGASRKLNLTLSHGATVTVTIARPTGGHMVKKSCRIKAVKGKRCTLMVLMATRKYRGTRGRDSLTLPVGTLHAGQYVGTVWAQSSGLSSTRHTFKLTIKAVVVKPPPGPTPTAPPGTIPAPKNPTGAPTLPPTYTNPTPTPPAPTPPTPITPPQAKTWGQTGKATTLVVYDTTGQYGWIGELDAIAAGNLASHFGKITAEPVVDYQSGQINQYTATIYIGSTYDEPIPTTFLNDVLGTTHPVIWASDNIWQLSGSEGSSADSSFKAKYGWDPSASFFDGSDNPTTITYNAPDGSAETFTRSSLNGTNTMLQPDITNPSAVKVLATANCSTASPPANCASQAPGQSASPTFPWAIRSSNLTYIVEDPLAYISETDRYLIFSDLLFDALDPTATTSHLAMVRLEDVSVDDNPTTLKEVADWFKSQNVPFSVNVIPEYTDPFGIDNADVDANVPGLCPAVGQACTVTIADPKAAPLVAALKYVETTDGGTLNDEGFTHQYSDVPNPYTGISGDDAEFYQAICSSTQGYPGTPVTVTASSPCPNTDYIVWEGPLPGDSEAWALGRVDDAISLFDQAGLGKPPDWVTPHYFASVPDYQAIDSQYSVRYDRETFPSGLLTGKPLDYSRTISQFFPYVVHDVYGAEELPENLGDYEPTAQNGNPPRTAQDIVNEAQNNLAVRQGFASFFYDSNDDATDAGTSSTIASCMGAALTTTACQTSMANLETAVAGIKALGYTFVGATNPTVTGG
jgi:uncharacterized protein YdaL